MTTVGTLAIIAVMIAVVMLLCFFQYDSKPED